MGSNKATLYASLLFRVAIAMPWMGPMPTPIGLMDVDGVSPRPTEAPGLNGIPRELLRREQVQWPPPANWCGFVDGIYDYPLSCSVGLTCVNSGQAIGCCTATTGLCSALYTTCANFLDVCGLACQQDPAIRKCDALHPFCGTYAFPGNTFLFNCMVTSMPAQGVEFMNDFYKTAIGSTLAKNPTTNPFSFTASASLGPNLATPTNSQGSSTTSMTPSHGLSHGAIDGIAAGAAVIVVLIVGLVAFFCLRARKRKRTAAAANPPAYTPPPMQQQAQASPQTQAPPPKAFDGYQSVPQQEQHYAQYPGPHQQAQSYFPPSAPAVSPQSSTANDPRFSMANASLLSSQQSEAGHIKSHHKAPISPTVTEVDGSMGNPGVPTQATHGAPTEVDGTMGNPGVPAGGHGIEHQLMPGGSPSAAEIEGRVSSGVQQAPPPRQDVGQGHLGASMNQPFSDGPYELGHLGR